MGIRKINKEHLYFIKDEGRNKMDKDKQENYRIKINLTTGELEAEGSKQFVEKILGEYGHKLKSEIDKRNPRPKV